MGLEEQLRTASSHSNPIPCGHSAKPEGRRCHNCLALDPEGFYLEMEFREEVGPS